MPDLLYEIGVEELPASYLEPALEQIAAGIRAMLEKNRLAAGEVRTAGTPRRMALAVSGIPERQPPVSVRTVGPPARVAFGEDGAPTGAAVGFARKLGVPVEALEVEEGEKGTYVVAVVEKEGRPAAELLAELLARLTADIGFPKSMHWGKNGFQFARPVRWLVALLDGDVLPVRVAGLEAGRATSGHPFLAPGEIELPDASWDGYLDTLRRARVIADVNERREAIRREIAAALARHGSELRDEALLDEVTNMVEFPRAVEGRFDEHFLEIPAPLLVAAMKGHQRYFPVRDADGRLAASFITVSNRAPEQDGVVREGNERVLLARLEDAKFFWEEDLRRHGDSPLEALVPRLADVVFLGRLGDNLQRAERLVRLGGRIARRLGDGVDVAHVERAARLCKADLLTNCVAEFPALQGIIGMEMARVSGEPEPVATAIREHYLPGGADSSLPATPAGTVLALADKLDVIVSCFSLGLLPTGSQDPYALRRNALGILEIVRERWLDVRLDELIGMARAGLAEDGAACDEEAVAKMREFFGDRLYHAALERGFGHDFVRAVLAADSEDVRGFWDRLAALTDCAEQPFWPELVEVVDRTYRIQKDLDGEPDVREDLLSEPTEKELAAALAAHRDAVAVALDERRYVDAAKAYHAAFAALVHTFFEDVFVNVDDEALQRNRKSLLGQVYRLFADRFANLYLIESAEAEP